MYGIYGEVRIPNTYFLRSFNLNAKIGRRFCAQMQRRCANEALEQKDSSEYEGKLKANSLSSLRRCYFTDNTQVFKLHELLYSQIGYKYQFLQKQTVCTNVYCLR